MVGVLRVVGHRVLGCCGGWCRALRDQGQVEGYGGSRLAPVVPRVGYEHLPAWGIATGRVQSCNNQQPKP